MRNSFEELTAPVKKQRGKLPFIIAPRSPRGGVRAVHAFFFSLLFLVGCVVTVSFATDEFALLKSERIGSLRIELPETAVLKIIPCSLKRGPETLWGADGLYHQKWDYAACGISLDMVSEKKGGRKTIASIKAVAPSTLRTGKGIGIGSSEQDVMKAYQNTINMDDSVPGKTVVAGSIYGGLIFSLKNGRVTSLFLGAAAE